MSYAELVKALRLVTCDYRKKKAELEEKGVDALTAAAQLNLPQETIQPIIDLLQFAPEIYSVTNQYMVGAEKYNQAKMSPGIIARHLVYDAVENSPEAALRKLSDLTKENKGRYRLTAILSGVTVKEKTQITRDIFIAPFGYDDLPFALPNIQRPLPGMIVNHLQPMPTAFLFFEADYKPLFEDTGLGDYQAPKKQVEMLVTMADIVSVISSNAVAILGMWIKSEDRHLPARLGALSFSDPAWGSGPINTAVDFDVEKTRVFAKKCKSFSENQAKDWEVIKIAMSRLNRSRRHTQLEDRAIDIGTICELILMHDLSDSSNTEISFKLAMRGAWLLGNSVDERKDIFAQLQSAYKKRSIAVHRGKFKNSTREQTYWIEMHFESLLVEQMICKILDQESFPKWSTLVLGGDWVRVSED